MKVRHQLELLYFQVDKGLMCMDVYGYNFNFLCYNHNLSKFECKNILENLNNQAL
jgi:hypothetical protein